jgi:hypothetical protein
MPQTFLIKRIRLLQMQSIFLDPHDTVLTIHAKMVDAIAFTKYPNKGIVIWDTLNKVL